MLPTYSAFCEQGCTTSCSILRSFKNKKKRQKRLFGDKKSHKDNDVTHTPTKHVHKCVQTPTHLSICIRTYSISKESLRSASLNLTYNCTDTHKCRHTRIHTCSCSHKRTQSLIRLLIHTHVKKSGILPRKASVFCPQCLSLRLQASRSCQLQLTYGTYPLRNPMM